MRNLPPEQNVANGPVTERIFLRTLAVGLAFALVMLVATFVLLESVVRIAGLAPELADGFGFMVDDPHTGFKPRSGSTVSQRTSEFTYESTHNSVGFRDVEHDLEKPPGVFRILGLGDSFTYGVGVDFEDSYLFQLEKRLNERPGDHPRIEIIKAGIPRFFPEPERALLEHYGLAYSPDLILTGFLPNDVLDSARGADFIVVGPRGHLITREAANLGDLGFRLFIHSHVFRIIIDRYIKLKIARTAPLRWEGVFMPDGFHADDWLRVEEELTKISQAADAVGAGFVLFHIPQKGPWEEIHSYPAQRLEVMAEANGDLFIDLLPAMKRESADLDLYYPLDGHCTAAGYAVIAETLLHELTAHGLVP